MQFDAAVDSLRVGDTVSVHVIRSDKVQHMTLKMDSDTLAFDEIVRLIRIASGIILPEDTWLFCEPHRALENKCYTCFFLKHSQLMKQECESDI